MANIAADSAFQVMNGSEAEAAEGSNHPWLGRFIGATQGDLHPSAATSIEEATHCTMRTWHCLALRLGFRTWRYSIRHLILLFHTLRLALLCKALWSSLHLSLWTKQGPAQALEQLDPRHSRRLGSNGTLPGA